MISVLFKNGKMHLLHDEQTSSQLLSRLQLSDLTVERASHVEPVVTGQKIRWRIDFGPSGWASPTETYASRDEALAVERWLWEEHKRVELATA